MKTFFKALIPIVVLAISLFSTADAAYPAHSQSFEESLEGVRTLGISWRLNFCYCRNATIEKRKELVTWQVDAILQLRDPKEKLVVVAFAEGRLLQTFMLVNCLIWHGYKDLEAYVIGPDVHDKDELECFRKVINIFHYKVKFFLKSYQWAQDYIVDVNDGKARKGHSFDLVDVQVIANCLEHNPYVDFALLLENAMEPSAVIFELGRESGRDIKRYMSVAEYKKQYRLHFPVQEEKYDD